MLKQEKIYSYSKSSAGNQLNQIAEIEYKSPISEVLLETSETDFSSQAITNTDIKIKAQNEPLGCSLNYRQRVDNHV